MNWIWPHLFPAYLRILLNDFRSRLFVHHQAAWLRSERTNSLVRSLPCQHSHNRLANGLVCISCFHNHSASRPWDSLKERRRNSAPRKLACQGCDARGLKGRGRVGTDASCFSAILSWAGRNPSPGLSAAALSRFTEMELGL